jgi:hypothetical protein
MDIFSTLQGDFFPERGAFPQKGEDIFSIMEIISTLKEKIFGGTFPNRPRFFQHREDFFLACRDIFSGGCTDFSLKR